MELLNLGKVRGNMWYIGTQMSGTSTEGVVFAESGISKAYINDMYLNPDTGNIYQCSLGGEPEVAQWIYAGNIKGPMPQLVDSLDSVSKTVALTGNAGRILNEKIVEAGLYAKTANVDCADTVYAVKLNIENNTTTITILDNTGAEGSYAYIKSGEGADAEITISIGAGIGLSEGAVIKRIESSNANIEKYTLYNSDSQELISVIPSIWGSIDELQQDSTESAEITEVSELAPETTVTYKTSAFSKVINGIRTAMFQITHAKAVWWNKLDNKTVYDKITGDCLQYTNIVSSLADMSLITEENEGKYTADARAVGTLNTNFNQMNNEYTLLADHTGTALYNATLSDSLQNYKTILFANTDTNGRVVYESATVPVSIFKTLERLQTGLTASSYHARYADDTHVLLYGSSDTNRCTLWGIK